MFLVIEKGSPEQLRWLIEEEDIDINIRNATGQTGLEFAMGLKLDETLITQRARIDFLARAKIIQELKKLLSTKQGTVDKILDENIETNTLPEDDKNFVFAINNLIVDIRTKPLPVFAKSFYSETIQAMLTGQSSPLFTRALTAIHHVLSLVVKGQSPYASGTQCFWKSPGQLAYQNLPNQQQLSEIANRCGVMKA